jgi:phage shock protein PspC (stress-responsive transcriptional regulator)
MTRTGLRVTSGLSPIVSDPSITDIGGMEQDTTTTTERPGQSGSEYVRPREGRVLAGVAQGLANRLDLPVWLPRAAFIVTAFFGGLGFALYAAGWALMRSEDETESPAERFFGDVSSSRSWIGIGLIFLAALILLDNLTFLSGGVVWAVGLLVLGILLYSGRISTGGGQKAEESKEGVQQMTTTTEQTSETQTDSVSGDSPAGGGTPPTPTPTPPILPPSASKPKERSLLGRLTAGAMLIGMGVLALFDNIDSLPIAAEPRHYLALAVVILGAGLIVGGFAGRARWLIIIGAILVPTLMFSPVFEYDWNSDTFDEFVSPTTFEQVQTTYNHDVGNLVIDLTDLPWDGQTIDLTANVDAGNLEIRLPADVGIVGDASVDVGRVGAPGRETAGLGDPTLEFNEPGDLGTVNLDANVDVGNIDIRRSNG